MGFRFEARRRTSESMALYEHTFIARQDLSNAQAEALIEHFGQVLADNGGKVVGSEYWGLKTMSYKINKNRKGHYAYLRSDAPAAAVHEMERLMRIHEDVMRVLTVKVEAHEEGPSAVIQSKNQRDERGDRGDRGDRDRGPRRPRREDA
jgi:small subunit ribosomal protein S6